MVRTGTNTGDSNVYEVASEFKQLGMAQGLSVFAPDRAVWSAASFGELDREFVSQIDTAGGTFESKLRGQLAKVGDDARLLMAELLSLHLLITTTVGRDNKEATVRNALQTMEHPVEIPDRVAAAFSDGFVNPGAPFNTARPAQLRYLVRVGSALAALSPDRAKGILADPWLFRDQISTIAMEGAAAQRHALLHLLFPETFEAVVSDGHREKIIACFGASGGTTPSGDGDRDLYAIREAITPRFGSGFDFYSPRLKPLWEQGADPWVALTRWATLLYRTPNFDADEREYKLRAISTVAELDAEIRGDGNWLEPLRRLLQNKDNNLLDFRAADDFLKWAAANADTAREAIIDLWDSTASIRKRVQKFASSVGKGLSSPGNRTAQAAYLLMASDPARWPMYRPEPFKTFLELVAGAPRSAEGDRYAQAVQTCDELSAELSDRHGLMLRDRLDAQALIWAITKAKPDGGLLSTWSLDDRDAFFRWRDGTSAPASAAAAPAPAPAPSPPEPDGESADQALDQFEERLGSAAAKTHLPVSYLRDLTELLLGSDKRQLVLYGPPGTGKTFVAQQLAYVISGGEPEIVQFHPSTTYEDFFEGIRPVTDDDGSVRYRVLPGPLAELAATAERDRSRNVVLIIDELNRANLPKVLGELLFLFEYRDVPVRTLYRGSTPFRLPPNLYVIATMNTVDRSVALVDAAMRRRFHFVSFYPDDPYLCDVLGSICSADEAWVELLVKRVNEDLVSEFRSRDYQLGWSHFVKADRTVEGVARVWRHTIEPLIEDHLYDEPERMNRFRWTSVYARHVNDSVDSEPAPTDDDELVDP